MGLSPNSGLSFVSANLYDMLIFSTTLEEYLKHLCFV